LSPRPSGGGNDANVVIYQTTNIQAKIEIKHTHDKLSPRPSGGGNDANVVIYQITNIQAKIEIKHTHDKQQEYIGKNIQPLYSFLDNVFIHHWRVWSGCTPSSYSYITAHLSIITYINILYHDDMGRPKKPHQQSAYKRMIFVISILK
jgi:hypothetical protein